MTAREFRKLYRLPAARPGGSPPPLISPACCVEYASPVGVTAQTDRKAYSFITGGQGSILKKKAAAAAAADGRAEHLLTGKRRLPLIREEMKPSDTFSRCNRASGLRPAEVGAPDADLRSDFVRAP